MKKLKKITTTLIQMTVRRKGQMGGVYSGPYAVEAKCG